MGNRKNIFDMSKNLPLLPRFVTDVSELWRVIYGSQSIIYGCLRLTTIWRSVRNRKKNPCMWTRYYRGDTVVTPNVHCNTGEIVIKQFGNATGIGYNVVVFTKNYIICVPEAFICKEGANCGPEILVMFRAVFFEVSSHWFFSNINDMISCAAIFFPVVFPEFPEFVSGHITFVLSFPEGWIHIWHWGWLLIS